MSTLAHGDNIETKIRQEKNPANRKLLEEIYSTYLKWKENNLKITTTTDKDIEKKVALLNDYKQFIINPAYKKEKGNLAGFTSQSQLHSSVLEEFMYYLFKDIPKISTKKFFWDGLQHTRVFFSLLQT